MNYKKIIENWLKEFSDIKLSIDADWTLIEDTRINAISAIDPSKERTGKTYKFNSEVENIVIEIESIQKRLDKNIKKIHLLNEAMNRLDYTERMILELRYIKKKKWNDVCEEMNYEYSWAQELKSRALKKLVKILFPENEEKVTKINVEN